MALSGWMASQLKAGNRLATRIDEAYDRVKQARLKRESEDAPMEAKTALAAKRQAEEAARQALLEAEQKVKSIEAELSELAPGRQLIRFLKQRASAEDYRRHLGLVSLVRRDFEELSNLLIKAAEERDTTLPQIDRIVLYIDDLDRCRANRVIEVLEAVHLLLAFPLFAVVVAVDPRWLRQSLLDHYPRLLGGIVQDRTNVRVLRSGRPATPQDYLEKIFQLPFHLQSMDKSGFDALVRQLFPAPAVQGAQQVVAALAGVPAALSPIVSPVDAANERLNPSLASEPASRPLGSPPPPSSPPPSRPDPIRLSLTKHEIEALERYQPLFQTPRALKRFGNTYCLIRVGVDQWEWNNFLDAENTPQFYRYPMTMLAVASAFPTLARPWLLWLLQRPPESWQLSELDIKDLIKRYGDITEQFEWEELGTALSHVNLMDSPQPRVDAFEIWVPRVARYSF